MTAFAFNKTAMKRSKESEKVSKSFAPAPEDPGAENEQRSKRMALQIRGRLKFLFRRDL